MFAGRTNATGPACLKEHAGRLCARPLASRVWFGKSRRMLVTFAPPFASAPLPRLASPPTIPLASLSRSSPSPAPAAPFARSLSSSLHTTPNPFLRRAPRPFELVQQQRRPPPASNPFQPPAIVFPCQLDASASPSATVRPPLLPSSRPLERAYLPFSHNVALRSGDDERHDGRLARLPRRIRGPHPSVEPHALRRARPEPARAYSVRRLEPDDLCVQLFYPYLALIPRPRRRPMALPWLSAKARAPPPPRPKPTVVDRSSHAPTDPAAPLARLLC